MNNYIDIVKELIEVKVNVNVEVGGNILFIVVCEKGDICIVEMLIKVGVDINLGVKIEIIDMDEDIDE